MNVLGRDRIDLVRRFSRHLDPGVDPFLGLAVATRSTGAPILTDALA